MYICWECYTSAIRKQYLKFFDNANIFFADKTFPFYKSHAELTFYFIINGRQTNISTKVFVNYFIIHLFLFIFLSILSRICFIFFSLINNLNNVIEKFKGKIRINCIIFDYKYLLTICIPIILSNAVHTYQIYFPQPIYLNPIF